MSKLLNTKAKQRENGILLGAFIEKKAATLKDSLLLNNDTLGIKAMQKLAEIKKLDGYKTKKVVDFNGNEVARDTTSIEKRAFIVSELRADGMDKELSKKCFMILDSYLKKGMLVDMLDTFKMLAKLNEDGTTTYRLELIKVNHEGNCTEPQTIWTRTIKQDFLDDEKDLINEDNSPLGTKYVDMMKEMDYQLRTGKQIEGGIKVYIDKLIAEHNEKVIEKLKLNKLEQQRYFNSFEVSNEASVENNEAE